MARLDALLRFLRRHNGSDLHLSAGLPPHARITGLLRPISGLTILESDTLAEVLHEVTTPHHWQQWQETGDADFAYAIDGVGRFRVNLFRQENGPAAVFRLIPEAVRPLEEIGVPKAVENVATLSSGLVIVTGATGAGKSTTLAAIVDRINATQKKHIVAIEDPIEFVHRPKMSVFSQREIGSHAKSFALALRGALREDPDVILVGELRDTETISLALMAAEMGCLVLSTLHTNSASKSIDRLIDVYAPEEQGHVRLMLSEALAAVIAQALVPTADGVGRVPVNEILFRTTALPNIIREGNVPMLMTLMQSNRGVGMQTMDDHLEQLAAAGTITDDVARRFAVDRNRFDKRPNP